MESMYTRSDALTPKSFEVDRARRDGFTLSPTENYEISRSSQAFRSWSKMHPLMRITHIGNTMTIHLTLPTLSNRITAAT